MAFPIPEPYEWDSSFQVFYDQLDEEHKGLFKGVFAVAASPGSKDALKTLSSRISTHFNNEEAMMQGAGYSDFASHKAAHDEFVSKLGGFATPVSGDNIRFAKNWLVNHIKGTDFKYKGKL